MTKGMFWMYWALGKRVLILEIRKKVQKNYENCIVKTLTKEEMQKMGAECPPLL